MAFYVRNWAENGDFYGQALFFDLPVLYFCNRYAFITVKELMIMDKQFDQSTDPLEKKEMGPESTQGFDLQAQINAMVQGKSAELEREKPAYEKPARPKPRVEERFVQPIEENFPRQRPQPRVRRPGQREDFRPSREGESEGRPRMRRVPQNRRENRPVRGEEGQRPNRRTYRRSQSMAQRQNRWGVEDQGYDPLMDGFDQEKLSDRLPEDVCETMPKELGKRIPGLGIPSAEFTAKDRPEEIRRQEKLEENQPLSKEETREIPVSRPSIEPVEIPERDQFQPYYPEDQVFSEEYEADEQIVDQDREDRSYKEEHYPQMPDDVCETMPKEVGKRIPGLGIPAAQETAKDRPVEIWQENRDAEESEEELDARPSSEETLSKIQRKRPSAVRKKTKRSPVQEISEEESEEGFEEEPEKEETPKKGLFHRKRKEKPKKKSQLQPVDEDEATENLSPLLVDRPRTKDNEEDLTRKIDRREIQRLESEEDDDLEDEDEYLDEGDEEEEKPSGFARFFKEWLVPVIIAVALAMIINVFLGGATLVKGESMEPTLHNKEVLIVSKIPTYTGKFNRSDIVILDSPDKKDEYYVKRIIGLPGEKVDIVDGHVFINEKLLKEYYVDDLPTEIYEDSTWKLGEDEYFVMGDNRKPGASNDSRLFGPIKRTAMEEVARFRIFPFSKIRSFY